MNASTKIIKNDLIASLRRANVSEVAKGNVVIGGRQPVSIQSMTNTPTADVTQTVDQILRLEEAGCEIVRVAVPTMKAARVIDQIKDRISIPLVADIHFNYKLALESIDRGVDSLRINPGNIGSHSNVREVTRKAHSKRIPIRIGINGGSLEEHIKAKYKTATAKAMVESALSHIRILEELSFRDIIISLKSSSVPATLEAYRIMASYRNYPLHLGVTEAGTGIEGRTKSFLGIGLLLLNGIGETIRISLTGDPVKEVQAATDLLDQVHSVAETAGNYLW